MTSPQTKQTFEIVASSGVVVARAASLSDAKYAARKYSGTVRPVLAGKRYIVLSKGASDTVAAVVAPKGYSRCIDGTIARDGTPSPEMGRIEKAWRFKSRRSAALTASAMGFPEIKEVSF